MKPLGSLEPTAVQNDCNFMAHIFSEICDYAVKNDMEPDATLTTIAENIVEMLKIATFNDWKLEANDGCSD